MTKTGFELCGISQNTPLLKEFYENQGGSLYDFAPDGFILCKGFREEMLKNSNLRPFFFEGKKIPREFEPFFSIIKPALNHLDVLYQERNSEAPIHDLLLNLKIHNPKSPMDVNKIEIEHLQLNYVITGIQAIEKIFSGNQTNSDNEICLLLDVWSILGEFYHLEALILGSKRDLEYFKNLPQSDLCPRCLEPMENPKDGRSSNICKKCRSEIKIDKQRQRRGTRLIGERYCGCGCGETFNGPPQKKYKNATHGRRVQKR